MKNEMGNSKYTFAAVATDMAIFTIQENRLMVLLIQMKKQPYTGMWALPGGLIGTNESLDIAANRILYEKTGVQDTYLGQIGAFGDVDRDPFGRVVSIAYMALIASDAAELRTTSEYGQVQWFPIEEVPSLAYDHAHILDSATEALQHRLMVSNIAYAVLPKIFTLTELQRVYEIILRKAFDKRNFRKRMRSLGLVTSIGKKRIGTTYRPAELYRFTSP